jgi:hypothetical protein
MCDNDLRFFSLFQATMQLIITEAGHHNIGIDIIWRNVISDGILLMICCDFFTPAWEGRLHDVIYDGSLCLTMCNKDYSLSMMCNKDYSCSEQPAVQL